MMQEELLELDLKFGAWKAPTQLDSEEDEVKEVVV